MASVDIVEPVETGAFGNLLEIVKVQADNGEEYESSFLKCEALFIPIQTWAASDSVGCTTSAGTVTVNLVGTTTDVNGLLLVFNMAGV